MLQLDGPPRAVSYSWIGIAAGNVLAVLFISHASKDDELASQLESWLRANGFTDLFIDHTSILAGAKWQEALEAASGACRVVVCLVTENWLNSNECMAEFSSARYMGKRIIPLFDLADEAALAVSQKDNLRRVRAQDQGIDLRPFIGVDGRLDFARDEARAELLRAGLRAAGALFTVGLDPNAFPIDRAIREAPFPGLESFGDEDADAALFFGRSREIADTLEVLRKMRADQERRPLFILGASGAGKSSLLKAGIIPRLRRESPAWIALRAFRPGADPLLNFSEALTQTLQDFGKTQAHGGLKRSLLETWQAASRDAHGALTEEGRTALAQALEAQGARLRAAASRPEATILIAIDQAEELVRAESGSAEALADYLRAAQDVPSSWRLVFTIRTDSFPELQKHRRFQNLEAQCFDLRALPVIRFTDVVEAPARRYGVEIDPGLVDALAEDSPKSDALPLLAFAMQRLWDRYAADGVIRLADYASERRLSGLIEDAAERALCGIEPGSDVPLPAGGPRKSQDALGERTFVPALADVNEEGKDIRRVAAWTGFDAEQQALLESFGRWRLLVRKGAEGDGGTVEVAHETLFRAWPRLDRWLIPERAKLETLHRLKSDTAVWDRKSRKSEFLTHRGKPLKDALRLKSNGRYAPHLIKDELAFLSACKSSERWHRLRTMGAVPLLVLLAVAGYTGFIYGRSELLQRAAMARFESHRLDAAELASKLPKDEFQECAPDTADCPVMVILPEGEFMMGSAEGSANAEPDESPSHKVSVSKFAVSKFEITWDQWNTCVDAGGCNIYRQAHDSQGRGGRNPVFNVDWNDAQDYANWLSKMTGAKYRLLSEAEWEYAARGGTTTAYFWGDGPPVCDPGAANGAQYLDCRPQGPTDVGTYKLKWTPSAGPLDRVS